MPKIIASDVKSLGFKAEMYGLAVVDFDSYITSLIAEQSALLSGKVGAANYAITAAPIGDAAKRAELCLSAAEMLQRRINQILGNVVGTGNAIDVKMEMAQRKTYLDEAELLIKKIVSGAISESDVFSLAVIETEHYEVVP